MQDRFFDTNVLIYLASGDNDKAATAERLLLDGGTISVQVLIEIANVARRKMRMSWMETHEFLELLRSLLAVLPITLETHESGLALAERNGLSTYDAMIAASALQGACDTLWSEDMQQGMLLEGRLRIVNPFQTRAG
jgi:predicted nucleic acid-binding protein